MRVEGVRLIGLCGVFFWSNSDSFEIMASHLLAFNLCLISNVMFLALELFTHLFLLLSS